MKSLTIIRKLYRIWVFDDFIQQIDSTRRIMLMMILSVWLRIGNCSYLLRRARVVAGFVFM